MNTDKDPKSPPVTDDADVTRLTAKADLILEQLDDVVREMARMLRGGPS